MARRKDKAAEGPPRRLFLSGQILGPEASLARLSALAGGAHVGALDFGRLRADDAVFGAVFDDLGPPLDGAAPSRFEQQIARLALDETPLLDRARAGIRRMKASHLTAWGATRPELEGPPPGYVLILDQPPSPDEPPGRFREMLVQAQLDFPAAPLVVLTPGHGREGHVRELPEDALTLAPPLSPWNVFEGAVGVYTLSAPLGYEAIFANHRPRVFGDPFYAGWGLTEDAEPIARRERKLTHAQLFAAATVTGPDWYDPHQDALTPFETVLGTTEARLRAWREDTRGTVGHGIRLWKRPALKAFFGDGEVSFETGIGVAAKLAEATERRLISWGISEPDLPVTRIEDGFLRSRGLGADLVPPLSLVTDAEGIYFDPSRESTLDRMIARTLVPDERARALALRAQLCTAGISKYNLGLSAPEMPDRPRILVPGQVEDDASIQLGCGEVRTNLGLLKAARAAHPEAWLIYKPHPDVEAGLRPGAVPEAGEIADQIAEHADPIALIEAVDEVWTLTSLLGFEALLRDTPVTCLGAPFYAGWGLTRDKGPAVAHRTARPDLATLVHATLIDYPRYFDPVTRTACSVETALFRLTHGPIPVSPLNRGLSRLQKLLRRYAALWR